jgi:Tripartite tricarboxylate transporter TctB family
MRFNPKDIGAGLLLGAIGLFFAANAWSSLRIGQAVSMGPGYFPVVLGSILVIFAIVIALGGVNKDREHFGAVPWRGIALVLGGVIFFAITGRDLGLAPSLVVATFMAAMSPDTAKPLQSAVLSVAMTAFCLVIFVWALGLPYPVIGPWLRF